jgi:alkane 1-monooxygenase
MSPWIFLRYLFLPAIIITGWLLGGWWNFLIPVVCFIIHPLYSLLKKDHISNHEHDVQTYQPVLYRLVAVFFVPVLLTLTTWSIIISTQASVVEYTGLFISVGIINGVIGFTLIHEFIHRHTILEKIAARLLMLQNNYAHYGIEHINGHHIYACTPKDPHAARLNESVYRFLLRSVLFTALNSWQIEKARLLKKELRLFSMHNRLIQFFILHSILYALIFSMQGYEALLFYFFQSTIAIIISHLADYLQHYGLTRKETISGKFEKVSAGHAWNKQKINDSFNLFQIENHADHHIHPSHTYEQLVRHEESPTLPTSYSGMMVLSLLPPLWFRVMNKRLSSFTNKTM